MKEFAICLLSLILAMFSLLAALANHRPYQNQVNIHLNEASHEFFDDNDVPEAAKEIRLTVNLLRNKNRNSNLIDRVKIDNSINKLETLAKKMERGAPVKGKDFNNAIATARNAVKN
jgi:hypothetical protein